MAVYEKWQSERYNIGCKGCKEWQARCPNCHELVESADPISSNYRFCPYCGFDMKSDFQRVADRRQFTECVMELKKAKRLLKAAVDDFSEIKSYLSEPYSHLCDKWRYEDEALALIGKDGEQSG